MNAEQMELKLARSSKARPLHRRRNLSRASWWFTQMRNAVNETRDMSESGMDSEKDMGALGIRH